MIKRFVTAFFLLLSSFLPADILYVANQGFQVISVIDTSTGQIQTLSDSNFHAPTIVACTPDGKYCFVTDFVGTNLNVIDTATNTVSHVIDVGSPSFGMAISPDGKLALVAHFSIPYSVSIIDIESFTSLGPVSDPDNTFNSPTSIIFTPDGTKAYVTNNLGDSVSIIEMTMSTPTVSGSVEDALYPFNGPYGLAITPDGKKLYVSNNSGTNLGVVDTSLDRVITTISGFTQPGYLAITPDGLTGYVSNEFSDTVTMFSTQNEMAGSSITVENDPRVIAISSDPTVYVANEINGTVSFFPTSSMTVTGSYMVSSAPWGIAIKPNLLPPTSISGCIKKNVFLTQTDLINVITWSAPTSGATLASYNIYRDAALTNLAGSVPANELLEFVDHNRVKGQVYTYYVVSVGSNGNLSFPAQVTVTQKCPKNN